MAFDSEKDEEESNGKDVETDHPENPGPLLPLNETYRREVANLLEAVHQQCPKS